MRGESVSQHAVERTLGKLATDEEYRARFFENPAAAAWEAGIALSPNELDRCRDCPARRSRGSVRASTAASADCVSLERI